MLRRVLLAWTSAALVLCVSSCQGSTATNPGAKHATVVDHYIAAQAKEQQFSGTVLIAQHGTILLAKGYGWADQEQRLPNQPTTRFGIGSITKQFTAMAVLLLQERGKLHVEDHVCLYISDCPATWKPITLKNLLTHTSGIPDYARSLAEHPLPPSESLLQYIERQPLDFLPGSKFSYSNSGFALLGFVIQNVTGDSYSGFLQREIFSPLHLSDTGERQSSSSIPNLAAGYVEAWTKATPSDVSPLFAAGALYSTAQDLYRWDVALFDHKFASADSLEQMFTPQVTYCGLGGTFCGSAECSAAAAECYSYGYGWVLQRLPVRDGYVHVIWHSGLVPGFASLNYYYPDQDLTLIVLSNLESFANNSQAIVGVVDLAFFSEL